MLREKNPERSVESFCICSHDLEYFCSARHISPHIGICGIWYAISNKHHSPTDILSADILLFSWPQLWRHKPCFWIFPEIALGDGPKNPRISLHFWILKTYLIYFLVGFRNAKTMDTHSIFPMCPAIWNGFYSGLRIYISRADRNDLIRNVVSTDKTENHVKLAVFRIKSMMTTL